MSRSQEEIQADLQNIEKQVNELQNALNTLKSAYDKCETTYNEICSVWKDDISDGPTQTRQQKMTEIMTGIGNEMQNIVAMANTLSEIANNIVQNELKHSN